MLNKKRKGLYNIALATLIFAGTLNALDKPVNVYASEDYHSWRQYDERWADIQIGNTNIGYSGCFVTSIAIMAVHSGSKSAENFNPGLFALALNGIDGFDYYGSLQWSAVSAVIPDVEILGVNYFQSYDEQDKINEIRYVMEEGYYVICNVGNHWVFVEDVGENDVYMIDPATDNVLMFDSYENYNINYYEILTGKNPPFFSFDNESTSAVTTTFAPETTKSTTTSKTAKSTKTTTSTSKTTAPKTSTTSTSKTTVPKTSTTS
ncbi:MAG: hypothetical protein K2K02_11755, partial [Ruminococcus sp.]|nr:hypothetical protein [Ruminococcus sp.]